MIELGQAVAAGVVEIELGQAVGDEIEIALPLRSPANLSPARLEALCLVGRLTPPHLIVRN